ncbi:hypothetical protein [Demequina capsici]|uniref:Uncharacterized protein n=1 Tax=Demequina capsici TaxID=3075620 RepID=A0AA96F4I0_9MICO|nr:hypothetical protein [Demequina sp. OYTSA14]WNM23748.1 hypothetical protein RN606_10295 [Demequina sp. OYTSA14]
MKRRSLLITSAVAACLLALTVTADAAGRQRIDARLADAPSPYPLRFTGGSALLALATGRLAVTASLTADDVSSLISSRLPAAGAVELTDDAIGVHVTIGRQDGVAWVTLTPSSDGIVVAVDSVEIAGFEIDPSMLMGDDTSVTVDPPIGDCPGTTVTGVDVSPAGVDVGIAVDQSALSCLAQPA